MKKPRYTDSQIMTILKQAEAAPPIPELCREHGMSSASFYIWRDGCLFDGSHEGAGRRKPPLNEDVR